MHRFRTPALLSLLVLALLLPVRPAAAITQGQWSYVCMDSLGLRSASTQNDIDGAGYGMDNGNKDHRNCLGAAPQDWDKTLAETIRQIKAFQNSGTRYLLVVTHCPGLSADYPGTFQKCNKVNPGATIIAATPNPLSNYTEQELVNWVMSTLALHNLRALLGYAASLRPSR